MLNIVSKTELELYIATIRNALCGFDYKSIDNVIFFSNEAVYDFLQQIKCDEDKTVGDVMDIIEPFIPLTLTDKSINIFLEAANDTQCDINNFEKCFSQSSRMDFMTLISRIDKESDWINILNICEKIRSFKEISEPAFI